MAGGVCSFRTNPQRALFSASSRKTKVSPPYILQQWKGYLCKLLNWFTSYPQFSEFLVFPSTVQSLFIHCSCCSLMGFLHAWPVLLPPKFSSLAAFLLLTFFFFLTTQPPRALSPVLMLVFPITQVTHLLYRRTAQLLIATRGFFSFFSLFFPFSTLNHPPKLRIAFRKILI